MQIFMSGRGEKDYAPDQVVASVTFHYHAKSYDEALKGGVEKVKNYIDSIAEATDFTADDFKTRAYHVDERYHINRLEPKTEEDLKKNLEVRVSDGFFFSQYAHVEFDYDRSRLAKLLAISSKIPGAPMLRIDFQLKDIEAKRRELIAVAYEDAKKKAEALAAAAYKDLRDCVRVDIDGVMGRNLSAGIDYDYETGPRFAKARSAQEDFEQQVKTIDETFKPDDITVSKEISCVWETSN